MNLKRCPTCKIEKNWNEFNYAKDRKNNLSSECKLCNRERGKRDYQRNKDKVCARHRKYREDNLERCKQMVRDNYKKVKEENPEVIKKRAQSIKGRYSKLKAGAKKRGVEVSISREEFENIIKGNKCYYCDAEIESTYGHTLNRIDNNKGYDVDNVKQCCSYCNYIMLDFTIEDLETRVYKIIPRMKKLRDSKG